MSDTPPVDQNPDEMKAALRQRELMVNTTLLGRPGPDEGPRATTELEPDPTAPGGGLDQAPA